MTPTPRQSDRAEGDVNFGQRRIEWQQQQLDEATRAMLDDDARYFLHQALSTPCLNALQSAAGSTLTDVQGRHIYDFHGNSAHHVGYGHPQVVEAIKQQLDTLPFSPRRYTNQTAINLARRIYEAAPMDQAKVLFAPGGASAIGMALKLARLASGRFKTISWWDAFHGASLDAISIGGEAMFRHKVGPLLPGALHIPPPGARIGGQVIDAQQSVDQLEYVMQHETDIAAFIAEPVRCTGVVQPPAEYWQQVRKLCDQHGTLLIFDEIPLCLGRTGTLFACQYTGVQPDMVCWGKGLGGGVFPMAALIARAELDVAADSSIGHFTHEKSPVGSAAALATLDILENQGVLSNVATSGAAIHKKLTELQSRFSEIQEIRTVGMLHGVELNSSDLAEAVLYESLALGLSFKVSCGNVLTLAPPLTITEEEIEASLTILENALQAAIKKT